MDDLIKEMLELYDNSKKYDNLINHKNKTYVLYEKNSKKNVNKNNIIKYDGKLVFREKESFELKCNFIGSYLLKENVWVWGFVHELSENNINMSSRILKYALSFDEEKMKREDFKFIRKCLVNSRLKVKYDHNFDILMGLILMVTKLKVIIPIKYTFEKQEVVYFYGVDNPVNKEYL